MSIQQSETFESGMRIRREVMGDGYVDASLARNSSNFAWLGQQGATEYAWYNVWSRPGLDRKQRSIVCITLLAVLGKNAELGGHVRGALNNGLTETEIQSVY